MTWIPRNWTGAALVAALFFCARPARATIGYTVSVYSGSF